MVKVILSHSTKNAIEFFTKHGLEVNSDVVIVTSVRSLEGLRFRYEDVIRVPGWSNHSEVEEIEERILRTHVSMGPRPETDQVNVFEIDWDIDANLPTYTRDFLRLIKEGMYEYDICTYGTETH